MNISELFENIVSDNPPVIYVSGKTSTGKSTFARKLRDELGYTIVELEAVVVEIVEQNGFDRQSTFQKVLYKDEESQERSLFVSAAQEKIASVLRSSRPLVVEGAVANVETLRRVLEHAGPLLFVYFHPANISNYVRNLTSRFMTSSEKSGASLPLKFWNCIDDKDFAEFCKTRELSDGLKQSIDEYALASQSESKSRLEKYHKVFSAIVVAEV